MSKKRSDLIDTCMSKIARCLAVNHSERYEEAAKVLRKTADKIRSQYDMIELDSESAVSEDSGPNNQPDFDMSMCERLLASLNRWISVEASNDCSNDDLPVNFKARPPDLRGKVIDNDWCPSSSIEDEGLLRNRRLAIALTNCQCQKSPNLRVESLDSDWESGTVSESVNAVAKQAASQTDFDGQGEMRVYGTENQNKVVARQNVEAELTRTPRGIARQRARTVHWSTDEEMAFIESYNDHYVGHWQAVVQALAVKGIHKKASQLKDKKSNLLKYNWAHETADGKLILKSKLLFLKSLQ